MSPLACCLVAPSTLESPLTWWLYKCKGLNLNVVALFSKPVTHDPLGWLGDTFTPSRTVVYASTLHGSGHGLGKMSPSLSRPLGPPPGILYASMLASYGQRIFPVLTYSTVGPSMGYNFDLMMGQPLLPLTLSVYPFLSQSPGTPFPTSTSPILVGLLALPKLGEEECPLVVGSPSHSSRVVVGGMIPTITVSSSAAETTLSASPRTTPRVSTSCANVAGGDVCRMIQQHPHSFPK